MTTSVALCTYNGERYIREQLESIANQSMPVDEVVIGDDGSRDATIDIVNSFKDRLPIRIVKGNQRQGAIRNFLFTISECQGDIVFLSDQDDIWLPNKVETISRYFDMHNQVDALFTDAFLIDAEGKPLAGGYTLWDYFFDEVSRKRCELGLMIEEFSTGDHATGATMAFRKRLTERFPRRDDVWHDELIARLAVSSHSLAYLQDCLIYYRIHGGQQLGISHLAPNAFLERDYRLPEMPFLIEYLFLENEEDIRHIHFLEFRCRLKHQILGWANAVVHMSMYRRFYHNRAMSFALYDSFLSVRHTRQRIINKFQQCFQSSSATGPHQ